MATKIKYNAQEVIEALIDVQLLAERLAGHSTIRSNSVLRADVDAIGDRGRHAAIRACQLWFERELPAQSPPAA